MVSTIAQRLGFFLAVIVAFAFLFVLASIESYGSWVLIVMAILGWVAFAVLILKGNVRKAREVLDVFELPETDPRHPLYVAPTMQPVLFDQDDFKDMK